MPSRSPLVSVIIPAYNHELYVQETIHSIIAQSYGNIELIVLDDGSKDTTFHKIQELQAACGERFARTLFRTQANAGTCTTFNRLFAEARGKYVYPIASDDNAAPHAIERLVGFLEEHPDHVLAVGDNALIGSQSEPIGWDYGKNCVALKDAPYKTLGEHLRASCREFEFPGTEFGSYAAIARGNHIPNGFLVRASALRQTGGFTKEAPMEDLHLMLQLAKLGKMAYIDEVLFFYRWHASNTMKQKERVNTMLHKTLLHEQKLLEREGMETWRQPFAEATRRCKVRFRLGKLLSLCKVSVPGSVRKELTILGKTWVVSRRDYC